MATSDERRWLPARTLRPRFSSVDAHEHDSAPPRTKRRIEPALVWIVLVVAGAIGAWLCWQAGHVESCPGAGGGAGFVGGLVLLVIAFYAFLWVKELFRRSGDRVRCLLYLALFAMVLVDAVLAFRYGINMAAAICD